MPPRKVRTDAKASDADAQFTSDEECREPSPVLMSGDTLTSFLTAFANTQAEANRQLVQSLMASHVAGGFPATPSPSPSSTSKSGNMSKCTARFDGQSRDPEAVEAFIDSVEMYKECASVNDDLALRGLPMLLIGEAAVWWRGIRNEVSSWSEAVQRLRSMYGTPCPAYKLYRKIFANEQNEELADSFIVCIRGMIAKLPYVLPEEAKIDIIYGLLHKLSNIESLIEKARSIEESIAENSSASTSSQSAPTRTTTPPARPAPAGLGTPRAASVGRGNGATYRPPSTTGAQQSCSRSQVQPSRNVSNEVISVVNNNTASEIVAIHVICAQRKSLETRIVIISLVLFVMVVEKKVMSVLIVLLVKIIIFQARVAMLLVQTVQMNHNRNTIGSALIDTAARRSIAGSTLYSLLLRLGAKFKSQTMSVKLADGSTRTNVVLLTCVDVNCMSLCIPIEFVVFPDASNNETLLGIDFITKSKLVLNFSSMTWYTADRPQVIHPLLTESSRDTVVECASLNLLREDEGTLLTEEELGRPFPGQKGESVTRRLCKHRTR
ncbi:hypothetical protein SFRURICE_008413 [Spodoptera frugiperda]|nr:hypothetical protein SFRURICE_008413 [Spodoptera frugiperda]